jgi:hypothetical protein
MVLTGVAERIARLGYLDPFVPEDGQSLRDLLPPDRLPGMLDLVRTEGFGWRLRRLDVRTSPIPRSWWPRSSSRVTSDLLDELGGPAGPVPCPVGPLDPIHRGPDGTVRVEQLGEGGHD